MESIFTLIAMLNEQKKGSKVEVDPLHLLILSTNSARSQWMSSSRVVRASDSKCCSRNCPGFDPSVLRNTGIRGAADEAVLNIVHKKIKNPKQSPCKRN